jgi:RHS repeat-associated protein
MTDLTDSNAVYYYHFDGLGSVVALSDSAGNTVQTYEYTVYGEVAAADVNHPNPIMFTGRWFDKETGLYYYRARYYNPYIGRFLQTDPVGYGMNLYAYCNNNPLNFKDPYGLESMNGMSHTDSNDLSVIDPNDIDPNSQSIEPDDPSSDPMEAGGWRTVPGQPGWEVRDDQPHTGGDYPHQHYKYRGRPVSRKVDPVTGRQRVHGYGDNEDVPQRVIDSANKKNIVAAITSAVTSIAVGATSAAVGIASTAVAVFEETTGDFAKAVREGKPMEVIFRGALIIVVVTGTGAMVIAL